MNENIVKIEATGFQDLCNHFRDLEEKNKLLEKENKQLKADNKVLGNELTYFKELCVELEEKVNNLQKDSDCDLCLDCIECSKGLVETSIWSTAGGA